MKLEYLILDLVIGLAPILGLYFYKPGKLPKIKQAFASIVAIAIPFILVDQAVTGWWWDFNPSFITGIYLGQLPIEEILFFVVVPFSCLVLWVNWPKNKLKKNSKPAHKSWWWQLVWLILICIAWINGWWYTLSVSLLAWLIGVIKMDWKYLVLVLFLTAIFNGYLTARPVVIYNSETMSNWRIGTIPIEDFIYGLILIKGVVWLYEKKRGNLSNK